MAFGTAQFDSTCKKCSGPIKKGITKIKWAPSIKGSCAHAECFFESNPKKRNERNQLMDQNGIPIPQEAIPDGEGIPIEVKSESKSETGSDSEPQEAKAEESKPSAPPAAKDLMQTIAEGVLPIIQEKLNTKVDADEVKKIAEKALVKASEVLREEFTTKIIIEKRETGESKELKGLQHKQFPQLLALVEMGLNVFLYDSHNAGKLGGPGAGKTTAAAQVAEALDKAFYHISLNIQSQPSLIMGYKNAMGEMVSTDFRKWYEHGGVFLFDELDNANGNFLTSLNTALANGTCSFPDAIVTRHPDAYCIAAGNTAGTGANALHSSRQLLDAASRERFVFLAWQYDEKLERKVAIANNKESEPWIAYIQNTRKAVSKLGVKLVSSPRASITGAKIMQSKSYKFTPEEIADLVLFKGADTDTKSKLLGNVPLPVLS